MARGSASIEGIYRRHVQTVYRLCYSYLGSAAEAEDAVQATFMKLVDHPRGFESEQHEKAWLIVCASNLCKDLLKSAAVSRRSDLPDEVPDARAKTEVDETLDAVMRLPDIYKDVVYLHYYEGYKTDEIARMLGSPPSTIRNRLSEARKLLREALGGEGDDGN
jgi:RNA polymerase sigma-70 factor (ECF subfamily)